MAQARRQCTVSANVDREGSACFDLKFVQPFNGVLAAASLGSSSVSTEFALRLDSEHSSKRGLLFGTEFVRQSKELAACGYVDLCTQSLCHVSGKFWNGTWRLTTDWSLRDLDMKTSPSIALQQERLRSLKTSLKACLSFRYTQFTAELAGPPGDVAFGKLAATAEATTALIKPGRSGSGSDAFWQLHLAGVMGLLLPVGKSCAQDRFHLGGASGPWALKGFAENGAEPRARRMSGETSLGPKDKEHNALGGEALASAFLGASRPLDIPSLEGLRLMVFTSLGVLHPSIGTVSRPSSPLRASLGCGLALPLGPGMLELTFTQPVRWVEHDVRQRWQFGLRLQALG
ncbi:unnamed protein product [Symbiodinium sp. CCMP2592]|nr:unnamed protein product [Symbiodinium sp. CCMP2592]